MRRPSVKPAERRDSASGWEVSRFLEVAPFRQRIGIALYPRLHPLECVAACEQVGRLYVLIGEPHEDLLRFDRISELLRVIYRRFDGNR